MIFSNVNFHFSRTQANIEVLREIDLDCQGTKDDEVRELGIGGCGAVHGPQGGICGKSVISYFWWLKREIGLGWGKERAGRV